MYSSKNENFLNPVSLHFNMSNSNKFLDDNFGNKKMYSLFRINVCDVAIHTLLSIQGTCTHVPFKIKREVWLVIAFMVWGVTYYTC